jgi:hypothetical protein
MRGAIMERDKIFTDEELKQMGARTLDLLSASIEHGDLETALRLAQRMHGEFFAMHDLYRNWITHLLSIIGRRYGDEALAECLEETVGAFTRPLASLSGMDMRQKMEIVAFGLRGHLHAFEIKEHSDHFSISAICASGGRMVRDGAYDGPDGFLRIKNPQPMTFGRPDFPVYCSHCHFQDLSLIKAGSDLLFHTEPPENIGEELCKLTVSKSLH